MNAETMGFQAEVSKLLDIVAHSLYSNREIFLRELVSNASDACDKLRYAAITTPELTADDPDFRIDLTLDKTAGTLTIADNGIGMSRQDLIDNLGTIARSGTQAFVEGLSGDQKKDVNLIGQFGVGFYSAFMVADKVDVVSRKAGEAEAWRWTSDGKGQFVIEEATRDGRGTSITLHISKDGKEFIEPLRLRRIIKTYSDHIAIPVRLTEEAGKEPETLNEASALWTRAKSDVTEEQYKEFYHHSAHAFDDPWLTLHWKAEGKIEYSSLLFIPSSRPFDLFEPERKARIKLYVKKVFITDDCAELVPSYLRFLRGVVDSQDLSLNISREMLQHNPLLTKIKGGILKRTLSELTKKAEKAPEDYLKFWETFGAVLKEGIYEDFENRDTILPLARFRSTTQPGWVSLDDYVSRMKDGQDAIYYITGSDAEALKKSPQIEGFKARGVEVLLMTDPIDEFWVPGVGTWKDKPFKSATRGGADLSKVKTDDAEKADKTDEPVAEGVDALVAALKVALGDAVKDVRTTDRLTDSSVCLVADDGDMDMNLQRLLKAHQRLDEQPPRILEINPKHGLIRRLADRAKANASAPELNDAAFLLLDQALILEGEPVPDPTAFARRFSAAMEKGLA